MVFHTKGSTIISFCPSHKEDPDKQSILRVIDTYQILKILVLYHHTLGLFVGLSPDNPSFLFLDEVANVR